MAIIGSTGINGGFRMGNAAGKYNIKAVSKMLGIQPGHLGLGREDIR
ncbi:transcriptional regulator [Mesobacillus boroniphilus JCM 21738]|uniref:Transcriptional regulator n=1 Tax=Mesobacillus boroniphilus JCM 21738 TaxID=1294265 RepID=W4RG96_9BACI|nr:transcriptional regulator [Mesobacillus boroniphilus JCM 21738]